MKQLHKCIRQNVDRN